MEFSEGLNDKFLDLDLLEKTEGDKAFTIKIPDSADEELGGADKEVSV